MYLKILLLYIETSKIRLILKTETKNQRMFGVQTRQQRQKQTTNKENNQHNPTKSNSEFLMDSPVFFIITINN